MGFWGCGLERLRRRRGSWGGRARLGRPPEITGTRRGRCARGRRIWQAGSTVQRQRALAEAGADRRARGLSESDARAVSWEAGRRARLVSGGGDACSRAERRTVVLTHGRRASVGEGVLVWALGDAMEQVGAGRGERAGPREGEGGVGRTGLCRGRGLDWAAGSSWVGSGLGLGLSFPSFGFSFYFLFFSIPNSNHTQLKVCTSMNAQQIFKPRQILITCETKLN